MVKMTNTADVNTFYFHHAVNCKQESAIPHTERWYGENVKELH
jgi:hypothetical protein